MDLNKNTSRKCIIIINTNLTALTIQITALFALNRKKLINPH